jgi:hypothetical protein
MGANQGAKAPVRVWAVSEPRRHMPLAVAVAVSVAVIHPARPRPGLSPRKASRGRDLRPRGVPAGLRAVRGLSAGIAAATCSREASRPARGLLVGGFGVEGGGRCRGACSGAPGLDQCAQGGEGGGEAGRTARRRRAPAAGKHCSRKSPPSSATRTTCASCHRDPVRVQALSARPVARLVSMTTCSLSWAGTVPGRRRAALGGFDGDGWEAGAGQSGRVNPRAGVRYRVASIGGPPPDTPRTRLGARGAVSLGFAGRAASRMPTS